MKSQLPFALAAIACVAGAQPLSAQTAPEEADISGSAYGIALDPITIFATLSPTSAFDYPGQVSVIDRDELQTRQASTIADVLQDTPGVVVDGGSRRAGQAPTIRGFREEDILILVDGVRQSFLSVHDGRLFIDPDLLKSAEVVKGPISSLYGSGALGGVIALTTVDAADFLDPGETQGVQLKAGYQSAFDEVVLTSTGFARSEDGRFDVVASFTYRNAGDIELGDGAATPGGTPLKTLPNEDDIRSGLLKATAELSPDLKLTGTWITFRNDGINPNNPQGAGQGGSEENRLVDRLAESDQLSGKLSWNPAGNPLIDGNLLVYWTSQLNQEDENIDPLFPRDRVLERRIDTIGGKIDNRSRLTLSDTAKLTLTYGAEYYVDEQTGEDSQILGSESDPNTLNPVADAEAAFGGVFLQGDFNIQSPLGLPGELTVLPSIRWDTYDLTYKDDDPALTDFSDEAISKKLGVSYKPTPWLLLFANYGEAFRAPSFIELFAQGNHFPGGLVFPPFGPPTLVYNRFIPNPNLKPQDGTTIEGGLGFDFNDVVVNGDRLKIKGSYWKTDAKNFIDGVVEDSGCSFAPFPPFDQGACFTRFENRDAELDGVEISLTYDSARFLGGITYETIDGTDKNTGEFLGSLYPDRYIVHAGVKLPEIWSTIGARVTFADDFTKVNEPSLAIDGYTTLDLYASIQPLDGDLKGLRVDLGVDNVTDEAYARGAGPTNFEPGINYKAAVSWTYKW
ncbi:MAG: TonB-dependent hemoglobin/transferrin/lactoferrin family receptor [Rhodomicrobiaceae bacterium]